MSTRSAVRRFLAAAALLATAAAAPQTLDARPHDGLGEYAQMWSVLMEQTMPDWWLASSSALAYGAMGNMPALNSVGEVSALLAQLDQPYYAIGVESPDFYGSRDGRHPRKWGAWETWGAAQWNFARYDNAPSRPVYDPDTWGAVAGLHKWVDAEHLVGVTGSYNYNRARLHNYGGTADSDFGGGRVSGENFRVRAYAALVPENQPWWVVVGLSGGYASYDTRRQFIDFRGAPTFSKASPDGYEVGAFAALNARLRLTKEITFKPVLRLEYTSINIAKFDEHLEGSTLGSRISRFTAESLQSRLGAALEHKADYGPFQLTAACSIVWADEWSGNDIKITSQYYDAGTKTDYVGVRPHVYATQLFSDAVEITPSFAFAFRNGLVLHGSYQLQVTFTGQFAQNVTGGLAWRF